MGDAKLHRQMGLDSSFLQSLPTNLLEHRPSSSDGTGAAEVVAGQQVYLAYRRCFNFTSTWYSVPSYSRIMRRQWGWWGLLVGKRVQEVWEKKRKKGKNNNK